MALVPRNLKNLTDTLHYIRTFFIQFSRNPRCPKSWVIQLSNGVIMQEALKTWRWRLLKNLKTPFLIGNRYWSKTSPKFFSKKIPTITVARAVQNLGRNGPFRAGWLSNGKNFFIKLAQTCDEQMVKISERYLKPLLSNSKLTKFHWSH